MAARPAPLQGRSTGITEGGGWTVWGTRRRRSRWCQQSPPATANKEKEVCAKIKIKTGVATCGVQLYPFLSPSPAARGTTIAAVPRSRLPRRCSWPWRTRRWRVAWMRGGGRGGRGGSMVVEGVGRRCRSGRTKGAAASSRIRHWHWPSGSCRYWMSAYYIPFFF